MTGKKTDPVRDAGNFLVFGAPLIGEDEKQEVRSCLDSGWIGTGPKVAQFEKDFGQYKQADHAVAVSSCTAALHLSLLASNVGPGDEVITTPLTFCATVNAIIHAGATPVLADIDPATFNIDPAEVERKITPATKAILPVHFAGRSCDMTALGDIADRHGLVMIEDCAHAIETQYNGRHAGSFGDFGCFSFYVTKNLVTGEGGMVLTRRKEDADRIKILGLHGMSKDAWKRFGDEGYKHYQVVECGYKFNMTDIQAAIGLHQLRRLETSWLRRQEIWDTYQNELGDLPLILPARPESGTRHAYHLYTVQIDPGSARIGRDDFLNAITAENIGVGVHYRSIPTHPYYKETFGWSAEDYPHSYRFGEQTTSLPLSARLSDQDVSDVITAVRKVLGEN